MISPSPPSSPSTRTNRHRFFKKLLGQAQWTRRVQEPNDAPIHHRMNLLDFLTKKKTYWTSSIDQKQKRQKSCCCGVDACEIGFPSVFARWRENIYVREHPECYAGFSIEVYRIKIIEKNNRFTVERATSMDQHYGKCSPMVTNIGITTMIIILVVSRFIIRTRTIG